MQLKKLPEKTSSGRLIKQNLLYNLLITNPEGFTVKDLLEKLISTKKGFIETVKRLRQKHNYLTIKLIENKYKIVSIDERKLKNKEQKIIELNITDENINYNPNNDNKEYKIISDKSKRVNDLYNLLLNNPNGISIEEIMKQINFDKKDVSNKLYIIKQKGYNITNKAGIYKLESCEPNLNIKKRKYDIKNKIIPKAITQTKTEQIIKPSILPQSYKDKLKKMDESDKSDVIDMLKKAIYYQKSAMALIDASDISNSIIDEI